MNPRKVRAREIQERIRAVLLEDWDPCQARSQPGCEDEYDAYVGGVFRLLDSRPSPEALAAHLASVEQDQMGFATPPERLLHVARRLLSIDVRL